MATPSSVPKTIARVKDAATRTSVIARFKNSAPERASAPRIDKTASGDGSMPGEATREPNCQTSNKRTSGVSLNKLPLVFPGRQNGVGFIVSFLIEFLCRAGEVRTAHLGKGAIEHPRVGGFLFDRPPRDAIDIILLVKGELCSAANSGLLGDGLPIRIGMRENILGLRRDLEEPPERIRVGFGKALAEDIADHGDRSLGR